MTQVVIGTGRPIAMRTPKGFTNITARPLSAEQLANFLRHPDIAALVPDTDGDGEIADVQIGRRRAVAQVRKKGHELILSLSRSENTAPSPGTQPLARVATPPPDVATSAPRAKSPTGARAKSPTGARARSSTGARAKSPSRAPRTKNPTKIPRTKGSTYTPIATFKEGAKPPAPSALDIPTSRLPAGLTFGGAGAPVTSSPAANDFGSFSLDDATLEPGSGGAAAAPASPSRPAYATMRSPLDVGDGDAGGANRPVPGRPAAVPSQSPGSGAARDSVPAFSLPDDDDLGLDGPGTGTAMLGYVASRAPAAGPTPSTTHSLELDDADLGGSSRRAGGGAAALAGRAATVDARRAHGHGAGSAASSRGSLELEDDVGFGATVARPAGAVSIGVDDDVGFGATVARPGGAGSLGLDDDVGFGATVPRPGGAGSLGLDDDVGFGATVARPAGAARAATVDARRAHGHGASSAGTSRGSLELDDDVGVGAAVARPSGAGSVGLDEDVGFGATVARPAGAARAATVDARSAHGHGAGSAASSRGSLELDEVGFGATVARPGGPGSLGLDDDVGFGATVARPSGAGSVGLDDDVGFGATVARPGGAGSLGLDDDVGFGATVARPGGGLSLDLDDDRAYGNAARGPDDAGSRTSATPPAVVPSSTSFAQRAPGSPAPSTTRFGSPVAGGARAGSPASGVPASVPPAGARASSPAIGVPASIPAARGTAPLAAVRIAGGTPARADSGAFGAILRAARERGASDLHVSAARVTAIRVGGELVPLEPGAAPMSAAAVSDMLLPLLDDASAAQLDAIGYVDLALEAPGGGRLRANISRQQQGLKGTFRLALAAPASLEQLGLPADLAKVVHHHQGLIIVAGPSGHGKTTTLAAFVDLLNSTKAFHILTIEDPVEIVHTRKQAVISQRETGRHTTSFARGLKASLREDPDVIVIGELRDRESVEIALTAAETGHLVIATMSTPSAAKTIDRLIDMFPPEEHSQVRASIAGALRAIVAQRLLPKRGGGVVPAVELVTGVLPLAVLIRDDKLYQLPNLLQRGRAFGMIRMDESLLELVRAGKVDEETALAFAESKKDLAAQLRPAQAQAAAQPQAKTSPLWGFGKKDPR